MEVQEDRNKCHLIFDVNAHSREFTVGGSVDPGLLKSLQVKAVDLLCILNYQVFSFGPSEAKWVHLASLVVKEESLFACDVKNGQLPFLILVMIIDDREDTWTEPCHLLNDHIISKTVIVPVLH